MLRTVPVPTLDPIEFIVISLIGEVGGESVSEHSDN